MNIVLDKTFPEGDETVISKMTIEYMRELDCCQSESEYPDGCQVLTITVDDGGGGKFIRIKTNDSGWSIDDTDDITNLINDFKQRLNLNTDNSSH